MNILYQNSRECRNQNGSKLDIMIDIY